MLVKRPPPPMIFMTIRKEDTVKAVAAAMRRGAKDFIYKGDLDAIHQIVIRAQEVIMQEKNRVFLSFGHNELLKLKLKDFIENRLGVRTIVLADQPSQGLTIVEKLERAAKQCSFAVILLTKDDEQKHDAVRARQNVIHELGFFQGRYGRKNVVLLAERGVELFSNISGIVRIEFELGHFESIFDPLRLEIEQSSVSASS
jgi:predicted nucleotide-binding protein